MSVNARKGILNELPLSECVDLRRISLIKNSISTINGTLQCPGLRTLFLWNNTHLRSISASFLTNVKYLAVLDLSQTSIASLPKSVGNLKHLRFLNLSQTEIEKLPKSLAHVRSLLFLDVSGCKHLCELHSGIGEHKSMLVDDPFHVYRDVRDSRYVLMISKCISIDDDDASLAKRDWCCSSRVRLILTSRP